MKIAVSTMVVAASRSMAMDNIAFAISDNQSAVRLQKARQSFFKPLMNEILIQVKTTGQATHCGIYLKVSPVGQTCGYVDKSIARV